MRLDGASPPTSASLQEGHPQTQNVGTRTLCGTEGLGQHPLPGT